MVYYETEQASAKLVSVMAALVYFIFIGLLMLLVHFRFVEPAVADGGILINFGDVESASGSQDPALSMASQAQIQNTPAEEIPGEILTQDFEDAAAVPPRPEREKPQPPKESATPSQTQRPQATAAQEPPRQVNQQALFPGRTEGSTSTSEGTAASGEGNQGAMWGSPEGSHDGTGTGTEGRGMGSEGAGFDLSGRSVVGSLGRPDYGANRQGRVVVEIVVDAAGVVKTATYRALGSTTNDSQLVEAARRAALKSRFNAIEGDALQTGTITYNFILK